MILNMLNIKIILLLSLVAYASSTGGAGSPDDGPKNQEPNLSKNKNSESNDKPKRSMFRSLLSNCCNVRAKKNEDSQKQTDEAPVSTPTEKKSKAEVAEIYSYLQNLFNDCYEWIERANVEEAEDITKEYFLRYISELKEFEPIFKGFFEAHPENDIKYYEFLNLKRYGELFEHICKIKNVPVEKMVEDRITSAITRQLLPINTQIEDSDLAPAELKTEEQLKEESDDLKDLEPGITTNEVPVSAPPTQTAKDILQQMKDELKETKSQLNEDKNNMIQVIRDWKIKNEVPDSSSP
ncbi:uncharacterized protein LOC126845258 isoform X1 [Adelges cooleyi]|uniref:uncharacterized protein LOC126845258 isoform X1 n=1 Tax=Adelges cooleyi TaxID=133065 RepID=UPI00217FA82C|nr:uncharacterized protein LOC126845258 isoform X1 [Adelges cooleyi]